jgi:hypothetical protein
MALVSIGFGGACWFFVDKALNNDRGLLINGLDVQAVQKHRFLHVYLRQGKITINESLLPSKAAFDEMHAVLARLVLLPDNDSARAA